MPKDKSIVLIAGEESGDLHAAGLIRQLKTSHPHIKVSGIGGKHMSQAGAHLVYDLASYGVTGFTEIFRHFRILRQAFIAIKKHLKQEKPDLLILVDYPGFNLRIAKYAKRTLGLKILYYISPQIWAWKANRIHLIKECVDHMAVILPFEKALYEKARVPVRFVGHPLVEKIASATPSLASREALNIPSGKRVIALLPGSRSHEIERHMPILRETALLLDKQHPNLHYVIPVAGTIKEDKIRAYYAHTSLSVHLIPGKALDCMAAADFVIVASGTASLECALLKKPMCVIYKCSFITYLIASSLIKVKFVALCNLLVNRMMIQEFLQYDCNAVELSLYISKMLQNPLQTQNMTNQLAEMEAFMSEKKSDGNLLSLVESLLD